MKKLGWAFLLVCLESVWFTTPGAAAPTADGLYARFTTSLGTFYCQLYYDLVPRATGNFVSLADGTKDWLDFYKAQVVKRPFYDGLTIHRVISGVLIQGGSITGTGSGDPGYHFKDEFSPALKHDKAGVLAMANSGTNSNGSQFYITLGPQPSLDNHYTVFGQVVEGLEVVTNISNVPANASQMPVTPILISNVTILRIGAAAAGFDATAVTPPLPSPHFKFSQVQQIGSDYALLWQNAGTNEYRICYGSNFTNWGMIYMGPGTLTGRYINDFRSLYRYQFFVTVETPID